MYHSITATILLSRLYLLFVQTLFNSCIVCFSCVFCSVYITPLFPAYVVATSQIHLLSLTMHNHTHQFEEPVWIMLYYTFVIFQFSYLDLIPQKVMQMLDVGLFHLMSVPPPLPLPTDEQPVTNGCKTSKPLGQQTIVVLHPWTIQYKKCTQWLESR